MNFKNLSTISLLVLALSGCASGQTRLDREMVRWDATHPNAPTTQRDQHARWYASEINAGIRQGNAGLMTLGAQIMSLSHTPAPGTTTCRRSFNTMICN